MSAAGAVASGLDFTLPPELEAGEPPVRRDGVRLLVAGPDGVTHSRMDRLDEHLHAGDLLVVNTSATVPAAVDVRRADGRAATVHFSTALDGGDWVLELRPGELASGPVTDAVAGERVTLPGGAVITLVGPYPDDQPRLWRARVDADVLELLARHGRPIRYSYVRAAFPLQDYQTVFARDRGSAEMPSAGRPFTTGLVTRLVSAGVVVAPITLHTGVSSQEAGEPPLPERFRVPATTARLVEQTRAAGGRVIAVGTTVTRALETVAGADGRVRPRAGWTDLVLGPHRPTRVVDGVITGWHAPGASHLQLLQGVAGHAVVERAYAEALERRYRWHEFGDSALLLR